MKLIFIVLFSILALNVSAQTNWFELFDLPSNSGPIFFIDTQTYHNNTWQIGRPHKTVFDSAYSYPNAIITDTAHVYAINDTSVFVIKQVKLYQHTNIYTSKLILHFMYRLDIDSGEIAKVEVSGDSGLHWINVITEDTTYDFEWGLHKPRLDTSTNNWKDFDLLMNKWPMRHEPGGKNYPLYCTADTLLYRFTFISDSIQTNKEGWIMDNFEFVDWFEGIEKLQSNNLISIYPNPSNGNICIKQNSTTSTRPFVSIYDLQGKEVYTTYKIPANGYLHASLPDGIYLLKYVLEDKYATKQIIIKN